MRARGLPVAAAATLALVPGATSAPVAQLFGTVGPGFTITLQDAAGNIVVRVEPGTYALEVRDLSPDHNFRIFGSGVEEATGVEQEGTVTWTVALREDRYTIFCDPHPNLMTRSLTVGNPPQPAPTPAPAPKSAPRLIATVGPKATISLRSASGAVLRNGVEAGTYAIVVRDRSTVHNFHLVGPGVNRRTALAGTAATTWNVKLAKGVLRFYSDRAPKAVKGSIRVG